LLRQGFDPVEIAASTSMDGFAGSVEYRLFGRRRLDRGLGKYAMMATGLALAPAGALLNGLAGGGDILTAVATKPEAEE
jgi:hypothetical protein